MAAGVLPSTGAELDGRDEGLGCELPNIPPLGTVLLVAPKRDVLGEGAPRLLDEPKLNVPVCVCFSAIGVGLPPKSPPPCVFLSAVSIFKEENRPAAGVVGRLNNPPLAGF